MWRNGTPFTQYSFYWHYESSSSPFSAAQYCHLILTMFSSWLSKGKEDILKYLYMHSICVYLLPFGTNLSYIQQGVALQSQLNWIQTGLGKICFRNVIWTNWVFSKVAACRPPIVMHWGSGGHDKNRIPAPNHQCSTAAVPTQLPPLVCAWK